LNLNIEVISGFEEARLIYFGILQGLPVFDKKIMLVDIGGGSTEILVGQRGNIEFAQSLKIGAIRLTDKFFAGDPDNESDINQCKLYVEGMIAPYKREIEKLAPEIIIGSSGTIQAIAQMVLAEENEEMPRSINNFSFTNDQLAKVRSILNAANTLKKRTKVPGLDVKRADIIVAGSIILEQIFKTFNIKSMTVSEYALREGIIYDTIKKREERDHKQDSESALDNIRLKAVNTLFTSFPYEADHVRKVTALSLKIFDDLKSLHKCTEDEREYLEAASLLHEIGFGISHSSHHKHSYYIIRNSELMVGFNFDEIEIIALIARYHRKSPPKPKHIEFNKLNTNNQLIVKKLSAILRIADALDRSHQGIAEEVTCELQNEVVVFKVKAKKDVDPHIDIWSAHQKKDLFEEIYGKKCAFVVI
ncbi:MAG TPA: Ppx/GppA phosphatase family protein, partial [Leptospiraceae bacterium]|nr:Ppx/GppA phosphatase family protein [Leptospiraceae bacterium]